MAKLIFLIFFITSIFGDVFTTNCLSCHKDSTQLKQFMANYTLKYSSEPKIKKALFRFLRHPSSNKSIMPYNFIIKNGFKEDSNLTNQNLHKAINIYYKKFNLKNFIK